MYKDEKEKLTAQIARRYANGRWSWTGYEFRNYAGARIKDVYIGTWIAWKNGGLRGTADGTSYGINERTKEFTGDEAFKECFEWLAEEMLSMAEEVSERVAPYKKGRDDYDNALKGVI